MEELWFLNDRTQEVEATIDLYLEINKGINIANKTGSAIMIGHVWSADVLPALLKEIYPELKSKGYRFSTVSESNALKR